MLTGVGDVVVEIDLFFVFCLLRTINDLNRVGPSFDTDDGNRFADSLFEVTSKTFCVDRRGCNHQPQIGSLGQHARQTAQQEINI